VSELSVLVVGAGSMGKRHLKNILAHSDDWGVEQGGIAVYDPSEGALDTIREVDWDGLSYVDLFSDIPGLAYDKHGRPTAVIIATPPEFHYRYAAMFPNSHILVEKPLTWRLPWHQEEMEGRLVLAAMNMRFHPGVRWIRQELSNGRAGYPTLARAWYSYNGAMSRPKSPDAKLGPLASSIHDLDALLWAIRGNPGDQFYPDDAVWEDNATKALSQRWNWISGLYYRIPGPAHIGVMVEADFLSPARRRGMRIIGTGGDLIWDAVGKDPEKIVCVIGESEVQGITYNLNDMYVEVLEEFFARCRGEERKDWCLPDVSEVLGLAEKMKVEVKI